jgi:hypothetical protein
MEFLVWRERDVGRRGRCMEWFTGATAILALR